jgi:hypothetical protein
VRRARLLAWAIAIGVPALAVPQSAYACGGFYGSSVEVDPAQTIIVTWRGGVETYVFRPHFCGVAKDFGVILPIPSTLATQPSLGSGALYDQLGTFTAPTINEVCEPSGGGGCGGSGTRGLENDYGGDAGMSGVDVVDRGTVGDFDFVLLQATSSSAFTDWLDQNGFPHAPASSGDPYQSYVDKGWFFVAFKVHADTVAPPAGKKLCGDLGPIQLSFAATQPVVPARIAGVNSASGTTLTWRVALVAANQQQPVPGAGYSADLYFSGALGASDLSASPALGALAQAGERLTVLDVHFPGGDDIEFTDNPQPADFRTTQTQYKQCPGGCSVAGSAVADALLAVALLGLFGVLRRNPGRRAREG